jgi:hypothetical protein
MTVAAMQMALMKVWAQGSYRVAMRLEPAEHALDALLVEVGVVGDRRLAVCPTRDAGLDPEIGQGLAKPVAVVAFVGDQHVGGRRIAGRALDG